RRVDRAAGRRNRGRRVRDRRRLRALARRPRPGGWRALRVRGARGRDSRSRGPAHPQGPPPSAAAARRRPGRGMKSGFVSLVGRPNAGKSTLLNRLAGQKLAIVSDKPQTTRHRIVGVCNVPAGQIVFIDTPGIHKPMHRMNRRMVDAAVDTLREVDVVVLVVDASVKPGTGDRFVLDMVTRASSSVVLALNKVDLIGKTALLPLIAHYSERGTFAAIV